MDLVRPRLGDSTLGRSTDCLRPSPFDPGLSVSTTTLHKTCIREDAQKWLVVARKRYSGAEKPDLSPERHKEEGVCLPAASCLPLFTLLLP